MEVNFDGSESSGSEVVLVGVLSLLEAGEDGLVTSWAFSEVVGFEVGSGGGGVHEGVGGEELLVLPSGIFYTSQRYGLKFCSISSNYLTSVAWAGISAENVLSGVVESINVVEVTSLVVALPCQFLFGVVYGKDLC